MDKFNTFLKMFYAPLAGMRDARERLSIFGASLVALVAAIIYELFTQAPYIHGLLQFTSTQSAFAVFTVALGATHRLLFVGLVFVPVLIFAANLFERRGSLRVVVGQEYASLASVVLMAWAAASVVALPVLALLRASGVEQAVIAQNLEQIALWRDQIPGIENFATPQYVAQSLASQLRLIFFAIWAAFATREVFRLPVLKTITVVALGSILMFPLTAVLYPIFRFVIGSPLLLIFLFIFLRGYFTELTRAQRARADFRQNLESATLNPADASAHYNLGLIHLERKELTEARERFTRAVEIDPEETDSHFRLGHISRLEGKYPEAIEHFGQVVTQDQTHAQHEIWREIGATYLAAAQHEDATDALERFLDHRSTDPEGLYLQGRALAALDRPSEAREFMQRCVEAVRSAPAYKYRMEKRWMTEAQAFLRSQA